MLGAAELGGRTLKEVFILYGSQTGNSEYIAKDMYKQCCDADVRCQCASLNSVKGLDLKALAMGIIVVCSTTGNGDCPENADNWWRAVKLRKSAKDMFEGIPYAVLGLGDTNYDKFCYMGKMIDKRLSELGAVKLMDLVCADEAVGLEDAVEDWKTKVLPQIVELHKRQMRKEAEIDDVSSISDSSDLKERGNSSNDFDLSLDGERTSPSNLYNALGGGSAESSPSSVQVVRRVLRQPSMLDGTMDPSQICNWLNLEYLLNDKPPPTLSPRSPRCETQPCRFSFVENSAASASPGSSPSGGGGTTSTTSSTRSSSRGNLCQQEEDFSCENPFITDIISARWLSSKHDKTEVWGESKRVVEMKVAVNEKIGYNPGDALGFLCPNPPFAISIVFNRLSEFSEKSKSEGETSQLSMATIVYDVSNNTKMTLEEFLTWKLDLTGPLKKSSLYQLAKYCCNPLDTSFIEWICNRSNEGQLLWQQFVESQKIGIAEFLALVPSCCPPLSAIVTASNTMVPRFYSVASSPLVDSLSCAVAFSIHRFQCGVSATNARTNEDAPKICRFGLATSYFEQLLEPWLYTSRSKTSTLSPFASSEVIAPSPPSAKVRVFLKPATTFRLPGSSSTPLLLIGPGTGVAPFIGFLDHRRQLKQLRDRSAYGISTGVWRGFDLENLPSESISRGNVTSSGRDEKGKVLLFFGCRAPYDYLYKDKLEEHLSIETLTSLDVAFSRVTEQKEYVTHRLLRRSEEVASLILDCNGCVYICGDGSGMAKDVYNTIKTILMNSSFCNGSEAKAVEYINDMKQRRRYLLDIWG